MPKTSARPVIFTIFRTRCWVQIRSSEPPQARTRLRPPTSTQAGGVQEPDLDQVDDEPGNLPGSGKIHATAGASDDHAGPPVVRCRGNNHYPDTAYTAGAVNVRLACADDIG